MASRNLVELLRCLVRSDVECIVVGGMAGVMRGSPVMTVDVDIVHNRHPDNVQRLVRLLDELQATCRYNDRQPRPTESHLMGPGHQLLSTQFGPLDVLGALDEQTYADLLSHSSRMELGEGCMNQTGVCTVGRPLAASRKGTVADMRFERYRACRSELRVRR